MGRSKGGQEMIDPMTALAGIQSAISMVKKASKVASDLGSLAPMIGKMFDAKSTATKALMEAKKGKGSNMGTALQIEMALEQARAFEEELKMLFMQTGKIDVWNNIKARQAQMDSDDANELRLFNAQERERKKKEEELNEWAVIIGASAFVLFILAIGGYELMQFCQTGNRCGR
jgi:hypothetical protein